MASNDDSGADVRRNRRRVRVRKTTAAAKTTTTNSTTDDVAAPNDNADPSTRAEAPEVETVRQDGSTDPVTAAGLHVHFQRTPTTTIKDSVDDSELTAIPRLEVAVNGELDVQPSTGTDDTPLNDKRNPPLLDVSPSHLPHDASKKLRGKRRVKNKGRKAAQTTNETATDHPLNDDEGDWFTAVRRADTTTIRRLAESRAIDVNSTDEVSQ